MKCNKCNKDVSEDSLFCEHCGAEITKTTIEEPPKSISDGKDIKNQIIEHLEFIGYKVDATDLNGNYIAKHTTKPTLSISFRDDAGILFTAFYKVDPKKVEKNKNIALDLINKMNNQSFLMNYSLGKDLDSLVCGTWFPNIYSKKIFSDFIDLIDSDIKRALQIENVMEIFG